MLADRVRMSVLPKLGRDEYLGLWEFGEYSPFNGFFDFGHIFQEARFEVSFTMEGVNYVAIRFKVDTFQYIGSFYGVYGVKSDNSEIAFNTGEPDWVIPNNDYFGDMYITDISKLPNDSLFFDWLDSTTGR